MKTFTFYAVFCTSIYFSHQQLFTFLLFFFFQYMNSLLYVCIGHKLSFFSTIFYWIIYTATRQTTDVVWKRIHFLICIHFLTIFLQVNFYRYSQKFGEETFSYVLTPPQTFSIKRRPVWAKKQKSAKFRERQAKAQPEQQQQQQQQYKRKERAMRGSLGERESAKSRIGWMRDREKCARAVLLWNSSFSFSCLLLLLLQWQRTSSSSGSSISDREAGNAAQHRKPLRA